jgi:outer membrane cobalamin receptor
MEATMLVPLFCSVFLAVVAPAVGAAGQLNGSVVDPDGRAVVGAAVLVRGDATAPVRASTDASGRFAVSLAPGRYRVLATAPGLAADDVEVTVADAQPTSVEIRMRVSAVTESLVVSAAQVDQPLSRTPDSVTVITGGELEARQTFTLGAALADVPGLTVVQSGGPGTLTSLFPRGGESDFTLVLVDGVRANAFGGGLDLSQVPLDDVDRVEVVRGPQSALYGSDAIGGVVQIVTRTGGTPSVRAQVEGGSRAMRRASAATSGEVGATRWHGGVESYADEGDTGFASNGARVSNDDARERQAWGGWGWRHQPSGADVQGQVRYVGTDRGAPGPYGSDPAHRFSGVDRVSRGTTERLSGGARWAQPWFGAGSRVRQRVELDFADYDLRFVSPFGVSEGETRRAHARAQTDAAVGAALGLSAGVEWLGERGASTFIVAGPSQVPVTRSVAGFFGEARWNAGDRVSAAAGLRAERIARDALAGDANSFSPRPDFPADTVVSINPKVAAAVLVAGGAPASGAPAWTRLRGAAGTGIRPPDAFEIAFTDNPGLKPERSRSFELGVTQVLAGGAVQIDATGFANRYTDLIVAVGRSLTGLSRYRTDNISNARSRGLELAAAWRAAGGLAVRGSYTVLDTEVLALKGSTTAPSPYAVGDPLLRRPRHQGSFGATWSHRAASAFLQVLVRGKTLDAEPSFGPNGGLYANPGRAVANIGGSWRAVRSIDMFARVQNLFDRAYEDVLGYPAPGRTAYAGVRVSVR